MNTAANPNSRWLFPGKRAGQPLHPKTLGYHNKHVTIVLADAGGTWKTYAPGDHNR
jgi:hypothetical protein